MKILVEKAVIEQALEALESAPVQYDFNSYPMLVMTPDTLQTTLTALRDALAEPELNLNCKSVQKRLATVWGYVKAEQEDEIDWIETNKALAKEIIQLKKQAEQSQLADASLEPVSIANNAPNLFGQVYLTCRENWNSHEGSLAAADEAVRLHGDEAVSRQDLTLIVEQIVRG